jgi:hypothetical protein
LVKRFGRSAPAQEPVLNAFEAKGWPHEIDNPLTGSLNYPAGGRLRDAIKHLNSGMTVPLIKFSGDGSGTRVRWKRVKTPKNGV